MEIEQNNDRVTLAKPIASITGFILFAITASIHLCYRFIQISDVGIGILLSLANALLLIFTMLWGLLGALEFKKLRAFSKRIKNQFNTGKINKDKYRTDARRNAVYFTINICYLVTVLCQLVYVIYNWDEVNV